MSFDHTVMFLSFQEGVQYVMVDGEREWEIKMERQDGEGWGSKTRREDGSHYKKA